MGKESSWSVTSIFEANNGYQEVFFYPDTLLDGHVSINRDAETITFDGSFFDSVTTEKMARITITFVNGVKSTSIRQLVIVKVPSDSSGAEDNTTHTTGEVKSATGSEADSQSTGANDSTLIESVSPSFDWKKAFDEAMIKEESKEEDEGAEYVPPNAPIMTI